MIGGVCMDYFTVKEIGEKGGLQNE